MNAHAVSMEQITFMGFLARKLIRVERINNSSLSAGAPMYYYCGACYRLAGTLPEGWVHGPSDWMRWNRVLCDSCGSLEDKGLLERFEDLSKLLKKKDKKNFIQKVKKRYPDTETCDRELQKYLTRKPSKINKLIGGSQALLP